MHADDFGLRIGEIVNNELDNTLSMEDILLVSFYCFPSKFVQIILFGLFTGSALFSKRKSKNNCHNIQGLNINLRMF